MPLPPPVLDDRGYAELRAELLHRIEVYTPEWTDRLPSDPGVTLLELVAFLGENLLYRFNQIPDTTRLWLLDLLHLPMQPALPARGLAVLSAEEPVTVERRTKLWAGSVPFETELDTTVLPVLLSAMIKAPAPEPTDPELRAATRAALDARGLAEGETPVYYTPVALDPDPARPGAVRLDVPSAVDGTLWLAVSGGPLVLPHGAWLNLGFALDPEVPGMNEVTACEGDAAAPRLHWQLSTVEETDGGEPVYVPVVTEEDTTCGLRRDGVVRIWLPADLPKIGVPEPDDPEAAGTGGYPPPLADGSRPLFWLRVFPATGTPRLPALRWVGANTAEAVQAVTAEMEFLGTGTGQPGQRSVLAHRPVLTDDAPRIEVEEITGWLPWTPVESFAASTAEDRHYVLDAEAGTVTFGDTVRGRAPQYGERIRIRGYRYGGGEAGNVAAGALTKVEAEAAVEVKVEVANPLRFGGGVPAETPTEALERIPGEFRRHDRVVTRDDFAELAWQTPGGEVIRADCLPRFHPHTLERNAAGVVTVVVWPRHDPAHPDAPRPDRALLRRVCAWLDARRLITTELYVIPPAYRRVAVSVGVAVKPGYSEAAVCRWVELVLRRFLSPLPPYGPEGGGWPLGHRVHGPELEAAALQVEGVDYLEGLEVAEANDDGTVAPGTVLPLPWEVVELVAVTVAPGGAPPVGAPPPGPPSDGTPVPIPVPGGEC